MNRLPLRLLSVLTGVAMLLGASSCGSKKPKPTVESKVTYKGMKLGRPGPVAGVIEYSDAFVTSDESVVSVVELEELRGNILVRWDWVAPGEVLYVSASRKVGPTGEGRYYPKAAASHAINVDREQASGLPGLWKVEVFIDGTLKESKKFIIEAGLTTILSPMSPPDPDKWALVVGIERYLNLPPVEFAATDSGKAGNYFVNLLGVPEKNLLLLQNEKATRTALNGRLKDYFPKNLQPTSTLYVYFAGHGMPDVATGEPYLAMFDSEATNVAGTGYPVKEFLADLGGLPLKEAYVFVDACFSGMAARGNKMLIPGARPAVIRVDDINVAKGRVVALGATTGNQLSHAYHDKRQGLFTYFLLSGIRGDADRDENGTVTMGELFGYVRENVVRISKRTAMEQVPSMTPRVENVEEKKVSPVPEAGKR